MFVQSKITEYPVSLENLRISQILEFVICAKFGINDRPNRATAAEAPLDGAQERYHFDNPTTHTRGAYHQCEAA